MPGQVPDLSRFFIITILCQQFYIMDRTTGVVADGVVQEHHKFDIKKSVQELTIERLELLDAGISRSEAAYLAGSGLGSMAS